MGTWLAGRHGVASGLAMPKTIPNTACCPQGNVEAAKKFQEAQKAYETLRDPEKRR